MAPFRITEPGIFTDIPANDYHADCCPTPSLTQSIVKTLWEKSPRHAWIAHPRLNPKWEPDEATKFNIGNCAHYHLLGRGKNIIVVDADDWRTKAAQLQRQEALAAGKVAVLREQWDRAGKMAEAAREQLQARGHTDAFTDAAGASEVMIAWREGDTWFRSLIDWLPKDCAIVWDYKTTAASAAPHALPNKVAEDGWAIQAAMHERGFSVLEPQGIGRRKHRFVCQENEPPYALTVSDIPESAMVMGRKILEHGLGLWHECMVAGTHAAAWPLYDLHTQLPEFPPWAEARLLDRETAREERRDGPRISVAGGTYQ